MLIDALIIILAISSIYRGHEIGFVRQLFSTAAFFCGLFIGAALQPTVIKLVHTEASRSLATAVVTLGCAVIALTIGEYAGARIKQRVLLKRINALDNRFGSVLAVISLLFSVWLLAAILNGLPAPSVQSAVRSSRIIRGLDIAMPDAPAIISGLGHLIDPNGFPQVFSGSEPAPRSGVNLPSLGDLQAAVQKDQASVVKVEGQGCGGIVEGSGFVIGPGLIATNAHVIAGIRQPYVKDANGTHRARPIWFDPNLDFAILRAQNLAGKPLDITTRSVAPGTAAAVVGYPGGGSFNAVAAAVLDQFTARGRNIYNRAGTERDVFEIQSTVIPGNSGGPLIDKEGNVIGVIFAESTSYQHVGYALTTPQVIKEINQAQGRTERVSTGSCAE